MRIAPSVWVGTGTTFAFGAVGFWLVGLTSFTLVVLCFVCTVIAVLSLAAAFREHYIRVGEATRPELSPGHVPAPITAASPDTPSQSEFMAVDYPEEPTPNIVAVLAHAGHVYLDHSSKEIRPGDGTRFDTPYFAAIVPYRNEPTRGRKVGDAFDVKARVAVGNQVYPVTGYWIQSDRDHISLPVGGSARDLVVALCDREGNVYLLDDHRDENNYRPAELLMAWTPQMSGERFPVEIQLSSEGAVLAENRYMLTPRPFGLAPS